jgi:hypothetical protein
MFDISTAIFIILICLYCFYKPTASYRRRNYVDAEVQTLEFRITTPHPITPRVEQLGANLYNNCPRPSRRNKTTFRGHRD